MDHKFTSPKEVRDLIEKIRTCKTIQEEHQIIAEASATIRTSLKTDSPDKHSNLLKLLYINMLGYPTHWAHLESINLIANSSFSDKRAGYLSLSLLLDENNDIMMLATNTLLHDLEDPRTNVVLVALSALGNIADETMARASLPIILTLLLDSRHCIRKKAILCATKITRKIPSMGEVFIPKIKKLLNHKYNVPLIVTVALMTEMCKADPQLNPPLLRIYVPTLVAKLNFLLNYVEEDNLVQNVPDPFLQVRVLRLLRLLCTGDKQASQEITPLLVKIASSTDLTTNAGSSVLYECVKCIMVIHENDHNHHNHNIPPQNSGNQNHQHSQNYDEGDIRDMAINTLALFLNNQDNNNRFVALKLLSSAVATNKETVLNHQKTVLKCLTDGDTTIRNGAVKLLLELINPDNVRLLVRELLLFFQTLDNDTQKHDLAAKLCRVIEKHAVSTRWYIDTTLNVLTMGISSISDSIFFRFLATIVNTPELHTYSVQKMFLALTKDTKMQPLVQACVWCIGEYAHLLLNTSLTNTSKPVISTDILTQLQKVLNEPTTTVTTRGVVLTALLKLSTRLPPPDLPLVYSLLNSYKNCLNLELQVRAYEFHDIANFPQSLRVKLLSCMPPIQQINQDLEDSQHVTTASYNTKMEGNTPHLPTNDFIGDLLGIGMGTLTTGGTSIGNTGGTSIDTTDVLRLGPSPSPSSLSSSGNNITDLFGLGMQSWGTGNPSFGVGPIPDNPIGPEFPNIIPFQNEHLTVLFDFKKPNPSNPQFTLISVTYKNNTTIPISNLNMLAAPPKYLKFSIGLISPTQVVPGGLVSQQIKVANSEQGKPLMMKLRLTYDISGQTISHEVAIKNFPESL